MHQPVNPSGHDRGANGNGAMCSGIRLAATEGIMWDRLHRKMWPNAGTHTRGELKHRMLRTLQADPCGPPMSKTERMTRMKQLEVSLKLPPDANNKLMGG
jgi:hypothetical protein